MTLRAICLTAALAACSGDVDLGSTEQAACNCDPDPAPCCCTSPIVIDIAGDGIRLTSWEKGAVFAMRPGEPPGARAWTQPNSDDAWLVLDSNRDGTINDGSELFGDLTAQPEPPEGSVKNGFLALAQHDDGNQIIDERDEVFSRLRLWQDKNHDGVSQAEEMRALLESGVAGISVAYTEARQVDRYGNAFRYRADVRGTPGSTVGMTAWDVLLTGPTGSEPQATGPEDEDVGSAIFPLEGDDWFCACTGRLEPNGLPIPPGGLCGSKARDARGPTRDAASENCRRKVEAAVPIYCRIRHYSYFSCNGPNGEEC